MKALSLLLGLGTTVFSIDASAAQIRPSEPAAITRSADQRLARTTKETVIQSVGQLLNDNYIFPDKAKRAAALLQDNLKAGRYDSLIDKVSFAARLTDDIRSVTHDLHIRVTVDGPPPSNAEDPSKQGPFLFTRVDVLTGNIGYIDLKGFLPRDMFEIGANAAMRSLAGTDALIIDLRHNHGGDPAAVAYMVSFFVGGKTPVHVNDIVWRKAKTEDYSRETFFSSPTPVSYGNKPVYLLISGDTFSGGEEFPYDLQSLKRATLVGQTTGGGANPGRIYSAGAELSVFIPGGRAENPVTLTNWEGTGVQPDVKTRVDETFATAYAATLKTTSQAVHPASAPDDVVTANLLSVRTTPQPGGEAAVRRQVAGLQDDKQPIDLFSPSVARDIGGPIPPDLRAMIVALGPLKNVTFVRVTWMGEDVYDLTFEKGGLIWTDLLNKDGKVVSTYFEPKEAGPPR